MSREDIHRQPRQLSEAERQVAVQYVQQIINPLCETREAFVRKELGEETYAQAKLQAYPGDHPGLGASEGMDPDTKRQLAEHDAAFAREFLMLEPEDNDMSALQDAVKEDLNQRNLSLFSVLDDTEMLAELGRELLEAMSDDRMARLQIVRQLTTADTTAGRVIEALYAEEAGLDPRKLELYVDDISIYLDSEGRKEVDEESDTSLENKADIRDGWLFLNGDPVQKSDQLEIVRSILEPFKNVTPKLKRLIEEK